MEKCPRFYMDSNKSCILKLIAGEAEGNNLLELKAEMTEGAGEKHLPVAEVSENKVKVKVGSVFHPMAQEHRIEWVYIKTSKGEKLCCLETEAEPVAEFALLPEERLLCAYAYCNLHGLWKLEMK